MSDRTFTQAEIELLALDAATGAFRLGRAYDEMPWPKLNMKQCQRFAANVAIGRAIQVNATRKKGRTA